MQIKDFADLTRRNQLALWREGSPRVPADFNPPGSRLGREAPFETLGYRYQARLYYTGSNRVPAGWKPRLDKRPSKANPTPWDELKPYLKLRLYQSNSLRVPADWVPPKSRQIKAWDDLSEHSKLDLWKRKSPRVPAGWVPTTLTRPRKKEQPLIPRETSFLNQPYVTQVKLYWEGKAPPDWEPKVEKLRKYPGIWKKTEPTVPVEPALTKPKEPWVPNWGQIPDELQGLSDLELHIALRKYVTEHPEVLDGDGKIKRPMGRKKKRETAVPIIRRHRPLLAAYKSDFL